MSIKGLSKAASALALVGVVAPFLVQSVSADEEQPTSALKDVAGVSDYSGSQIINSAAVSDANGSGVITGKSYAGIGFKSGDLILYQVPNFDFSMDNKIAANTYKMIDVSTNSEESNRMAVIVDNRYTSTDGSAKAGDGKSYNWTLTAEAGNFTPENSETETVKDLTTGDVQVLINDRGTNGTGSDKLTYNVPESQNVKDQPDKIYKPGTNSIDPSTVGLDLATSATDILNNAGMIAQSKSSKTPGPTAINFKDNASAEFVVLPGSTTAGIAKIVPNTKYVSTITWTLSASPLH
ncbi:hypothetical protein JG29_12920 [Bombilactobacillus mellis]|uniref:WxL domain-containing protein n=1 Tax=Bombilactobacillus mellis TaxID=1218508 RepID=A0A0F4KNJ1_9LACO|nr:WxL domain-containing protein [Bombilactobacillus mellis]KJY48242.1 hypothetical protein JG29_12920 [Bombilactobacillus mellis]